MPGFSPRADTLAEYLRGLTGDLFVLFLFSWWVAGFDPLEFLVVSLPEWSNKGGGMGTAVVLVAFLVAPFYFLFFPFPIYIFLVAV